MPLAVKSVISTCLGALAGGIGIVGVCLLSGEPLVWKSLFASGLCGGLVGMAAQRLCGFEGVGRLAAATAVGERRYRELLDQLPQIVFEVDRSGRITYGNRAAFEMFGYSESQFDGGLTAMQMIAPEDHERAAKNIRLRMTGIPVEDNTYTAVRSDGTRFPMLIYSDPILGDEGVVGLRGIIVDITGIRQAEAALRESEASFRSLSQQFHALLDAIPDAIAHLSPRREILWTNRHATSAIGKPLDVMLGERCFRSWYGLESPCSVCAIDRVMTTGVMAAETIHSPDGRTWEMRAMPVKDGDGRVLSIIELGRDITEQVKMEEQLRQSQKMEAIGTLAGGIAHDFNNMLAAIVGYTELSLLEIPEGLRIRDNLEQVLRSCYRARDLVGQILAFTRQRGAERRAVQLEPIVRDGLKLLRALIPATVEIRPRIEPVAGSVLADPTQLHQVLLNLCTNAAQAMEPQGGVLEVVLEPRELGTEAVRLSPHLLPGSFASLSVCDTGQGMDRQTLERIFDPYFTTKPKGVGTGLGLAVVHGIVREHQGAITVTSEPGRGTTFQIFFPLAPVVEEEFGESQEAPPQGGGHVLLVDDEASLLDAECQMLERLGYRVTAFKSSLEAAEAFRSNPAVFDIVLTDMTMPEMTGIGLAQAVHAIRPEVPVVLCTGFNTQLEGKNPGELGVSAVLGKPLLLRELAGALQRALSTPALSKD